jgi:hypothetical protein
MQPSRPTTDRQLPLIRENLNNLESVLDPAHAAHGRHKRHHTSRGSLSLYELDPSTYGYRP